MAHVGAFDPLGPDDVRRTMFTIWAIGEVEPHRKSEGKLAQDIINLSYDRDFLAERRHYDIVILHSIVSTKSRLPAGRFPRLRASRHHTLKAWRARLSETGARYISICEDLPMTMSGLEIGAIPGYKVAKRDKHLTLYSKVTG